MKAITLEQPFASLVSIGAKNIENDMPVAVSREDGLIPVLVGLAAKRSIELHKPVLIEDIKKEYLC